MTDQQATVPVEAEQTAAPMAELIGTGPAMQEVFRLVHRVAGTRAAVLLVGESGTGKQTLARAIHRLSRRNGPIVRVDCGGLPARLLHEELFGNDLFGNGQRRGCFDTARGGTLLLDDVDALPRRVQSRLLRVLQDGDCERPDPRLIAASRADLFDAVEAKRFREDLYYRLGVVTISLPPMRERRQDVRPLVEHFLAVYARRDDRPVLRPEQSAIDAVAAYDWPGNLGELRHCMERAVVLAPGDELTCDLLPAAVVGGEPRRVGRRRQTDLPTLASELVEQGITTAGPQGEDLHAAIVNQVERELIAQVMAACGGVQTKAATRLGINRNTLHKKLKQYGLEK